VIAQKYVRAPHRVGALTSALQRENTLFRVTVAGVIVASGYADFDSGRTDVFGAKFGGRFS
jgi:heterodisulfide reductase subunit A-like polyferredoxin